MLRFTDEEYDSGDEKGYYQHILLMDIVENFMVTETGEGMMLSGLSKTIVEAHAQRGIQELTYDTLRTIKSLSYDLEGALSVVLPQDAVSIVGVYWADETGLKHVMTDRRHSGNPRTPLKDSDGENLYDDAGQQLYAEVSDLITNYNARAESNGAEAFYNYFAGSFENEELYDRYHSYYGRRYGAEPSEINVNGTYILDEDTATIHIDQEFTDVQIVVDYISDGLGVDIGSIRIHKYAEEAIYTYIKYRSLMSKMNIPIYEKQLNKKEYSAAKRRAKHRLSAISAIDIFNVILNKQKWIKS